MICSWLNFILCAANKPRANSICTYNGFNNIPLILRITYKYDDSLFSFKRNCFYFSDETRKLHYVEPTYEWFLDNGTIVSFGGKLFEVIYKGNSPDASRISVDMNDCTIVCNDNQNVEENGYWGFKHELNGEMNVKNYLYQNMDDVFYFDASNVVFMNDIHPFLIDVEKNRFKGHAELISNIFYFYQRSTHKKDNEFVSGFDSSTKYLIDDTGEFKKLKKNIKLDYVVFISSDDPIRNLNSNNKKVISFKRFISLRSDNEIKIKNVPGDADFEEVDIDSDYNTLLTINKTNVKNAINVVHAALEKQSINEIDYKNILCELCENAFDPAVCDKNEPMMHLKNTFTVIFGLFQRLYKDQFIDEDSRSLFPILDVENLDFVDDCLEIINYYLLNSNQLTEDQKVIYEKAWDKIKNILETNKKIKTLLGNTVISKWDEFISKMNEIVASAKTQFLNELLNDIDALESEITAAKADKSVSEEKLTGIKNKYQDIELKSKEKYAVNEPSVKLKMDSLKYAEFVMFSNDISNKRRIINGILIEIDGFLRNTEDSSDLTKITESIEQGNAIDEKIKPYIEYLFNEQRLKYQAFAQRISELNNKNPEKSVKHKVDIDNSKVNEDKNKTEGDNSKDPTSKMSTTVIVVIVVSTLVGVGLIVGGGVYWYLKKKRMSEILNEEMIGGE